MKLFIKNNYNKFILDERYILNEADDLAVPLNNIEAAIKTMSSRLNTTLTGTAKTTSNIKVDTAEILNILKSNTSDAKALWKSQAEDLEAIRNILEKQEALKNRAELVKRVKAVSKADKEFIKNLNKLWKDVGQLGEIQVWQTSLNELEKVINDEQSDNDTIKKAFEKYLQDKDKAKSIISRYSSRVENADNLKKLDESIQKLGQKYNDIIKNRQSELNNYYQNDKSFKAYVEDLDKKISTTLPSIKKDYDDLTADGTRKDFKETLNKCQTDVDDLVKQLDDLNNLISSHAEADDNTELQPSKSDNDWEARFEKADKIDMDSKGRNHSEATEQVWKEYLQEELLDNATPEKSAQEAFFSILNAVGQEVRKLGYTANENPFIEYLKVIFQNKNLVNILAKNPYAYMALHSFVAKNMSWLKELRQANSLLGDINIIYHPGFFNGSHQKELLEQQAIAVNLQQTKWAAPDNTSYAKIKYATPAKLKDFIQDLMYMDGNVTKNTMDRAMGDLNNDLYRWQTIDKVLKHCFGEDAVATASKNIQKKPLFNSSKVAEAAKDIVAKVLAMDEKWANVILKQLYTWFLNNLDVDSTQLSMDNIKSLRTKYKVTLSDSLSEQEINNIVATYFSKYELDPNTQNTNVLSALTSLAIELHKGLEQAKTNKKKAKA